MTTIKIKFRPSSVGGKEGSLCFQVIHNRIVRQIGTGQKLYPQEWSAEKGQIAPTRLKDNRRDYLIALQRRLRKETLKLQRIVSFLEGSGKKYHTEDVVALYKASQESDGFLNFANRLADSLRKAGCQRRAEIYETTLNSFNRFYDKPDDIPLTEFDSGLMQVQFGEIQR